MALLNPKKKRRKIYRGEKEKMEEGKEGKTKSVDGENILLKRNIIILATYTSGRLYILFIIVNDLFLIMNI